MKIRKNILLSLVLALIISNAAACGDNKEPASISVSVSEVVEIEAPIIEEPIEEIEEELPSDKFHYDENWEYCYSAENVRNKLMAIGDNLYYDGIYFSDITPEALLETQEEWNKGDNGYCYDSEHRDGEWFTSKQVLSTDESIKHISPERFSYFKNYLNPGELINRGGFGMYDYTPAVITSLYKNNDAYEAAATFVDRDTFKGEPDGLYQWVYYYDVFSMDDAIRYFGLTDFNFRDEYHSEDGIIILIGNAHHTPEIDYDVVYIIDTHLDQRFEIYEFEGDSGVVTTCQYCIGQSHLFD